MHNLQNFTLFGLHFPFQTLILYDNIVYFPCKNYILHPIPLIILYNTVYLKMIFQTNSSYKTLNNGCSLDHCICCFSNFQFKFFDFNPVFYQNIRAYRLQLFSRHVIINNWCFYQNIFFQHAPSIILLVTVKLSFNKNTQSTGRRKHESRNQICSCRRKQNGNYANWETVI